MTPLTSMESFRLKMYGITPEEHGTLVAATGDRCYICKKQRLPTQNNLAMDHDHATGLLRGCLCWSCNRLLGTVRDNAEILAAAAEYLLNPPAITILGRAVYGQIGSVKKKKRRTRKKAVKK